MKPVKKKKKKKLTGEQVNVSFELELATANHVSTLLPGINLLKMETGLSQMSFLLSFFPSQAPVMKVSFKCPKYMFS